MDNLKHTVHFSAKSNEFGQIDNVAALEELFCQIVKRIHHSIRGYEITAALISAQKEEYRDSPNERSE